MCKFPVQLCEQTEPYVYCFDYDLKHMKHSYAFSNILDVNSTWNGIC
jgi:hypothetical protein